jgi:hypothetical protein
MEMKDRNSGSALALVLITSVVMMVLAGALFTLFQANIQSHSWSRERIQARCTAEAGSNMAIHMIMEGADVPQGIQPIQFLPEVGSWQLLDEEMGYVQVWVDPNDHNPLVGSANAYEVRCLSKVESEDQVETYGMSTQVLPRNFAVYATFLNNGGNGYYGDGYRFDGPFHSNTAVRVSSETAGRLNDPYFYSFSVASDYYYYRVPGTGTIIPVTTPQYGNLYMEPYERMQLGEPYFCIGADSIPFGSGEVTWQGAYNAALSGGLVLDVPDGGRMIIKKDTLFVKPDSVSAPVAYYMGSLTNNVVWIDNENDETVYLKSFPHDPDTMGLSIPLTLGVNGTLAVMGNTTYSNSDILAPNNDILLGVIVVHGDFVIAVDPDARVPAVPDWDDPFKIVTYSGNDDLQFHGVIMVLDGMFQLEDTSWGHYYWWPHPAVDITIMGGYIINEEGVTTWVISGNYYGYLSDIIYDTRLMSMHPPFYPQTGVWDTAYWKEWPDLNEGNIVFNYQ